MGIYGNSFRHENNEIQLTEAQKDQYYQIYDYVSETFNNDDPEVVQELFIKKDKENLENTDFDYKNIKIEDINSEQKFKRICLQLQNEDDDKMKKFGLNILLRHVLSIILMPAFGIGFILMIINMVMSIKLESSLPTTSWERIAKRLEKRKEKETDPKEIKKIEKMIDKLYDKAATARDSELTATIKK